MPDAYKLEISPAAERDLKRLPLSIQRDIVQRHLPEIAKDPFSKSKPLVGTLKGERSYSFGRKPEYRIIFYVEDASIIGTIVGTKEGIYRKAKRRRK